MRVSDCFMELIAYVAYFRGSVAKRQPSFDEVKNSVHRLISESERSIEGTSVSREDYDQARFAVFAWIDEAILSSEWHERNRWQGEQLQLSYFRTSEAGEQFFERLGAIGPHQREVREVYFLCLAMGFRGQYHNEGDEFLLEGLKSSNLKLLTGSSVGIPSLDRDELFPEAYVVTDADADPRYAGKGRFSFFTLACIAFPLVLYGGLYLIYRFILGNVGDNLLKVVG